MFNTHTQTIQASRWRIWSKIYISTVFVKVHIPNKCHLWSLLCSWVNAKHTHYMKKKISKNAIFWLREVQNVKIHKKNALFPQYFFWSTGRSQYFLSFSLRKVNKRPPFQNTVFDTKHISCQKTNPKYADYKGNIISFIFNP